jgi:hypothetical protein
MRKKHSCQYIFECHLNADSHLIPRAKFPKDTTRAYWHGWHHRRQKVLLPTSCLTCHFVPIHQKNKLAQEAEQPPINWQGNNKNVSIQNKVVLESLYRHQYPKPHHKIWSLIKDTPPTALHESSSISWSC